MALISALPAYSKILATVGNEPITTEDVARFKDHLIYSGVPAEAAQDSSFVLDYIINMRLAVMETKNIGLDRTEEAKDSIEGALYNYYIRKTVDSKLRNKKFSKQEIVNYYNQYPVIKMQRLALPFDPNNEKNRKEIYSMISIIRGDIRNKKATFDSIIEKYSQNDPTTLTGTFDKVPSAILSAEEKEAIKSTPIMEVSTILSGNNYFSIIRVTKKYPISAGDYKPINEILKVQATATARTEQIKLLRQKYATIIDVK